MRPSGPRRAARPPGGAKRRRRRRLLAVERRRQLRREKRASERGPRRAYRGMQGTRQRVRLKVCLRNLRASSLALLPDPTASSSLIKSAGTATKQVSCVGVTFPLSGLSRSAFAAGTVPLPKGKRERPRRPGDLNCSTLGGAFLSGLWGGQGLAETGCPRDDFRVSSQAAVPTPRCA